jgi:hypothetical protein
VVVVVAATVTGQYVGAAVGSLAVMAVVAVAAAAAAAVVAAAAVAAAAAVVVVVVVTTATTMVAVVLDFSSLTPRLPWPSLTVQREKAVAAVVAERRLQKTVRHKRLPRAWGGSGGTKVLGCGRQNA